jgi:hypothetical protein
VVAGATERLLLVTSVLVLPYRNPVLTAKMVASLDVLSGGRVTLGVGAGWLQEEFEALDSPAFEARGAVTDEWIAIFKQLAGCPVRRPRDVGRRRRLAAGGIRGAGQPRLRGARRGDRRVDRDLQAALVAVARQLRRSLLPLFRYPLRTLPGAEAPPADPGRRAFTGRPPECQEIRADRASGTACADGSAPFIFPPIKKMRADRRR